MRIRILNPRIIITRVRARGSSLALATRFCSSCASAAMKAAVGVAATQNTNNDDDNDDEFNDDDDDKVYQGDDDNFYEDHYGPHMVARSVGIFQTKCVAGLQLSSSDGGAQPAVMIATNTQKYVIEFTGKYRLVLTVGCNVLVGWSVSAAFSVACT